MEVKRKNSIFVETIISNSGIMVSSVTLGWRGQSITISRESDGRIVVTPEDLFPTVKAGLIEIAESMHLNIDRSWNTRYMGKYLIKSIRGDSLNKDNIDLIEIEARLASSFLEEDPDSETVKISIENVAKVEAMISYDSKYYRSGNELSAPDDKWIKEFKNVFTPMADYKGYRGSSAFWLKRISDFYYSGPTYELFADISSNPDYFRFLIFNAVCAIDSENSTHLNADTVGREQLTDRIVLHQSDLISLLKDTSDYPLIEILSKSTDPQGKTYKKSGKDVPFSPRNNFSFATKFCHYACFFLFEDHECENRDLYSIYDNVVVTALKEQYGFVDITETTDPVNFCYARKYKHYQQKVDEIRNGQVSRNGFDHLMWYYYKGKEKSLNKLNQ